VLVDPMPLVKGIEGNLLRVLQNLIVNAIKYRSERPIEIHVTAERSGAEWIIRVNDNGIGIAPEHRERIFGLLERLHGAEIPGAGMGLAICKKIIEAAGGVIWVESTSDSGSTFCFTVTAATAASSGAAILHVKPCLNEALAAVVASSPVNELAQLPGVMHAAVGR
jgi:signal transduction histidine kinase